MGSKSPASSEGAFEVLGPECTAFIVATGLLMLCSLQMLYSATDSTVGKICTAFSKGVTSSKRDVCCMRWFQSEIVILPFLITEECYEKELVLDFVHPDELLGLKAQYNQKSGMYYFLNLRAYFYLLWYILADPSQQEVD